MKTVLQQFIEIAKEQKHGGHETISKETVAAINYLIEQATSLLPVERDQHKNQFILGFSLSGEGFNAEWGCNPEIPKHKEYLSEKFNDIFNENYPDHESE